MKIQTSGFKESDFVEWSKFVSNHHNNNIFQSPEMYNFYDAVDNYSPYAIICRVNGEVIGSILVLIIRENKGVLGWLTSRAIVYGDPIIDDNYKNTVLEIILNRIDADLKSKAIFIQFRNSIEPNYEVKSLFELNGYKFQPWSNINVRTISLDEVLNEISKSKLRQVKRGEKSDILICEPENLEDVLNFYEIIKEFYNTKVGKPFPSLSFFENFYHLSRTDKLGIFRVAKIGDKVVGGFIAPKSINTLHEWYIVALDNDYKGLNLSVILTWNMIRYAHDNKLRTFDFMGSGSPDNDYGVRDFKLGFSKNIFYPGRFEKVYYPVVNYAQKVGLRVHNILSSN